MVVREIVSLGQYSPAGAVVICDRAMELVDPRRIESPEGSGRVRLVARLVFDREAGSEDVWWDVPAEEAPFLSETGNPWLAGLLALAAYRNEPLRLSLPVDAKLLAGAHEVLHIWRCWYPSMNVVPIEAPVAATATSNEGRTAALFSGGVDSFHTALREGRSPGSVDLEAVDSLITMRGWDLPGASRASTGAWDEVLDVAASALDKQRIDVDSNLRQIPDNPFDFAHCGVLAGLGLLLERKFRMLHIPSTHGYTRLDPGGSHPLTDPLFSTRATEIRHHGSELSRAAKLRSIVESPIAMHALIVCAQHRDGRNCGRCAKCYCTMLHLEVLGVRGSCSRFPTDLDVSAVAELDASPWEVRWYLDELKIDAIRNGRDDVASFIDKGIRRTERRNRVERLWNFALGSLRGSAATD